MFVLDGNAHTGASCSVLKLEEAQCTRCVVIFRRLSQPHIGLERGLAFWCLVTIDLFVLWIIELPARAILPTKLIYIAGKNSLRENRIKTL